MDQPLFTNATLLVEKFKRRSLRLETDLSAEVSFAGSRYPVCGRVLNLSREGMFLYLPNNIPGKGKLLTFSLQLDRPEPLLIEGSGVVRWSRTQADRDLITGCGIEFLGLNEEATRTLLALIEKLTVRGGRE